MRREYKNLDLVIELPGYAPLVIENKVFSLPDETQLRRYAAHRLLGSSIEPTFVLLSVADPGWSNATLVTDDRQWPYLSYREMAERIRPTLPQLVGFDADLMHHELQLLDQIAVLIELVGRPNAHEMYSLSRDAHQLLADVRIDDGIGKLRGHHTMALIHEAYRRNDLAPTRTEVGFSRGQPLLAAFWIAENGDGIGWQYQSNQWRTAMILDPLAGRGSVKAGERAAYAARYLGWFDFEVLGQVLGVDPDGLRPRRATVPAEGFNKYDPNFVYRYRLLPGAATVQQIVDLAVAYGRAAQHFRFE